MNRPCLFRCQSFEAPFPQLQKKRKTTHNKNNTDNNFLYHSTTRFSICPANPCSKRSAQEKDRDRDRGERGEAPPARQTSEERRAMIASWNAEKETWLE